MQSTIVCIALKCPGSPLTLLIVLVCTIPQHTAEVGVSLLPLVPGLPEISVTRSCGLRGPWTAGVWDFQPEEELQNLGTHRRKIMTSGSVF